LFLVNDMEDSRLKRELLRCSEGPFKRTDFSIGHRGAALQFPEHTRESYEAGARMGAGILECDVTFTKDKELVCRHAQNDLATTTNILVTPLASTCIAPFTPALLGPGGTLITPATAECRTSEITLAEFKSLTGKMDAFNPRAQTPQEFLGGTPNFRTDLYSGPTSGHLLSHKESIELFKRLGVKMTPEFKSPSVTMPFNGFSQAACAQKMIDGYKAAGVSPRRVWAQSFDQRDVLYWINHEPAFSRQAVYLDDANVLAELPTFADLVGYKQMGVNIVAPPIFALLDLDSGSRRHNESDLRRAPRSLGGRMVHAGGDAAQLRRRGDTVGNVDYQRGDLHPWTETRLELRSRTPNGGSNAPHGPGPFFA
jgi:glycerophosphoryl diester phosphodiesterase